MEKPPGLKLLANIGSALSSLCPYGFIKRLHCACAQGKKHGPFYYLVSGLKPGNVLKFLLKSASQQQYGRQGVAHYQEFWERLEELSQVNAELLRRNEPLHHG